LFVNVKRKENLGPGALAEDRVCDFGIRNAEFENRELGFEELVDIGVGADPEPGQGVAGHGAEGAVAPSKTGLNFGNDGRQELYDSGLFLQEGWRRLRGN
jgi:hypothetical protein